MARHDECRGVVRAILPRMLYRIQLDDGHDVTAHVAEGPHKNFVRLVVGDTVVLELAAKDVKRGRIVRKAT